MADEIMRSEGSIKSFIHKNYDLPLGEMRANECFFGFKDNVSVNSKIFGATKEHQVIKMILDTYEEDSFLNNLNIDLERRIYFTLVGKLGVKNLSKGVKIVVEEGEVFAELAITVDYGVDVVEVVKTVQNKVKIAIENMTGLEVADVNIRIAGVEIPEEA